MSGLLVIWRAGVGRLALLLWLGALAPLAGVAADNVPTLADRIANEAWYGDFAAIERLYNSHAHERDAEGYATVRHLREGLSRVLGYKDAKTSLYHDQVVALTLQWTERQPQSPLAHALHVRALVNRAWWFRGSEFAHKVPADAMAEFTRTIQRARDHAARHGRVALLDSTTHFALLIIGKAQGWGAQQLWAVASAGLDRNPEDDALFLEVASALTPKWGASARDLDRTVMLALERTKAARGHEVYARMYSRAASDDYGHRLFEDSHARWPLIKQGFEDWLARYPSNRGALNRFAYFACMARDQQTALDLLGRIGAKPDLDEWGPSAARTLETCQRWAGRS